MLNFIFSRGASHPALKHKVTNRSASDAEMQYVGHCHDGP